ncbi:MAG: hypothetical protein IPF52_06040 [Saprospiraceae bacterium]|nr:hypothetical protein [Saprospiraceae bacterium]
MQKLVYFIVFSVLFLSCQSKKEQLQNPLYEEVMFIHDEVMPKMGQMHKLKKELKSLKDKHPQSIDSILSAIKVIDDADEGMMVWMAEFRMPEKKSETTAYLEKEKVKIQKVSDDMYYSMELAQKLINSLNQKK